MIDLRPIVLIVGILLMVFAALMLVPMLVDLSIGNPDWEGFGIAALVTGGAGAGMTAAGWGRITSFSSRQAFLISTASWLAAALAAALPLWFGSMGLGFTDAFFESMSGLTTTGSTVVAGLDTAPPGFLLWRSILQWIGGVGIVIFSVALLPFLSVGGMQLFRSEAYEPSDKVVPSVGNLALAISGLYVFLTVACFSIYWLMGMSGFDAINHAMTTVSTGGFSTRDASFGHFIDNPDITGPIDIVASVFMILAALPFTYLLLVLRGRFTETQDDSQASFFLLLLTVFTGIIFLRLITAVDYPAFEGFRLAFFNVTSVITGTGYASTDYSLWGPFAHGLFFVVMFIGGCSGSTSCGLKVFRLQIVFAALNHHAKRLSHPHVTDVARYNGRPVTDAVFVSVLSFFFLYFVTFATGSVVLTLFGLDAVTALSAAGTAIACVGPGLGDIVGPAGNFAPLPDGAKWVLAFIMLLGRLEILSVLVLFVPGFWKR